MALSTQQREDVFKLVQDEAATSPAKGAEMLRTLYDLIFVSNAQRTAEVQEFLDGLIVRAEADITNHDAGAAAGKAAMEARLAALETLRGAV